MNEHIFSFNAFRESTITLFILLSPRGRKRKKEGERERPVADERMKKWYVERRAEIGKMMMKKFLTEKHTGRNVVKTNCKHCFLPSINFCFVSALIAIPLSTFLSLMHSNFFPSIFFQVFLHIMCSGSHSFSLPFPERKTNWIMMKVQEPIGEENSLEMEGKENSLEMEGKSIGDGREGKSIGDGREGNPKMRKLVQCSLRARKSAWQGEWVCCTIHSSYSFKA